MMEAIQIRQIKDKQMVIDKNSEHYFSDLDIHNPYGKISCLVLYLYSMEIGTPPLYTEIN